MIEVPIFLNFDYEHPIGWIRIEADMEKHFISHGAIVPGYLVKPEGNELLHVGLVDRRLIDVNGKKYEQADK